MKSMILKDLYNISRNMKSLLFILAFLAVAFIPTSDVAGYVVAAAMICSMMVVTTFNFDETCGWNPYALVMPITRRELVAGKYMSLLLFTGFGILVGLVLGTISGVATGRLILSVESVGELLMNSLLALVLGMVVGGMNIPLLIKFGAERGRLILLISCLVPSGILAAGYGLLTRLGVEFTEELMFGLLCVSPLFAAVWDFGMYQISCWIFENQEL